MEFLNFKSCLADPDAWMRPVMKSDVTPYYEYVLLYVDDTLEVSKNVEHILCNELVGTVFPCQGRINWAIQDLSEWLSTRYS